MTKRRDMVGKSNPRWARDGRVKPGQVFGSWTVLSAEPFQKHGALYVKARCTCGKERDVNLRMMEVGRSKRCKGCATQKRHARQGHLLTTDARVRSLRKRASDWFQRCNNPQSGSYRNYGARGIECRFGSVAEAVEYILQHLPHETYQGLDIDRRDNNGHYEPGNLRLVTRRENLANRRSSRSTISSTAGLEPASLPME